MPDLYVLQRLADGPLCFMVDTAGPWWGKPKRGQTAATSLNATLDKLWQDDTARLDRYEKYYKLYGGTRLLSIRPWDSPALTLGLMAENTAIADALRLNVCKAAVDTITAKVGKARTRPTFLVNGGNYTLKRRAKGLQRFADGAYHQAEAYELGADMFRDAMVFGTGVMHTYAADKRLKAERVFPWELFVDPNDGLYGKPQCLYRVKWVSEHIARYRYGYVADSGAAYTTLDTQETPGYVRMVEAWSLPCGETATAPAYPGRHLMVIGSKVLDDSPWVAPDFPFVFFHWSKPVQGFWGDSAIREVVGIQVEINRLLQSVQEAMLKVGQPWVLKLHDVILTPTKLGNDIAQVIEVDATALGSRSLSDAISVQTFQSIHPQVVGHIWALYAKAFEILGSNQLAASATAPAGLESGRALEQLADEQSERFMTVARNYEHTMGKLLVRQFIRVAKELDAELKEAGVKEGFVIHSPGTKDSLRIKWDDVEIDEDAYLIAVFPTSVLPTTPAARREEVQRLSDAGWITPDTAIRLLQLPDLDRESDLVSADADMLDYQLEKMLEDGEAMTPVPYQNLDRALVRTQQAILRGEADGVPETHLDLARDFLALAERMKPPAPAAPTQAAPVPPAQGA